MVILRFNLVRFVLVVQLHDRGVVGIRNSAQPVVRDQPRLLLDPRGHIILLILLVGEGPWVDRLQILNASSLLHTHFVHRLYDLYGLNSKW